MMMSPSKMMGFATNFVEIRNQPVIDAVDGRLTITGAPARGAAHDPAADEGR
jgi:hypothetical protein